MPYAYWRISSPHLRKIFRFSPNSVPRCAFTRNLHCSATCSRTSILNRLLLVPVQDHLIEAPSPKTDCWQLFAAHGTSEGSLVVYLPAAKVRARTRTGEVNFYISD